MTPPTPPTTRVRVRDLLLEALRGVVDGVARLVLTITAIALATASFTAVVGLSDSAAGAVMDTFEQRRATEVSVVDQPVDTSPALGVPADAERRVTALNGVVAATLTWVASERAEVSTGPSEAAVRARTSVRAASPGYAAAMGLRLSAGRFLDAFDEAEGTSACVVARGAARQLGGVEVGRTLWLDGGPCVVVGVAAEIPGDVAALGSVLVTPASARARYGDPTTDSPARLLIRTAPGAADQVGREAVLALRPDAPERLRVETLDRRLMVADEVTGTVATLFLVLSGVVLAVAATGIANTSITSVLQRRYELGLRRVMGAQRRHIVAQVVVENAVVGALGGLLGASVGSAVVVVTSAVVGWTALLRPEVTFGAPVAGLVVGAVAGIYPAVVAGRLEPVEVLRG